MEKCMEKFDHLDKEVSKLKSEENKGDQNKEKGANNTVFTFKEFPSLIAEQNFLSLKKHVSQPFSI